MGASAGDGEGGLRPKLMLTLKTSRRAGTGTIPSHVTTLSVSWLNGQFRAAFIHRGVIESAWEHVGDIQGTNHFEELLREAVQQTNYHGQTVSLVLAHPRLAQQMLDVPPVKGTTLAKVVERQAKQQTYFVADAAWAFQPAVSAKGTQRVVLHLFPRVLRNQLIQGARRNKLHLVSIVPASAVLQHQLTQIPFQQGDFALLAAENAGSTSVVVGRDDGQIVLARTLPGTWNDGAERLGLDLNRTLLFASQQYGVTVNSGVWLFGAGAKERAPDLKPLVQAPVETSPVDSDPFYWATEVHKIQPAPAVNFVSATLQKAPQRRIFAKIVAASVLLLFLGSLGVSTFLFLAARQEAETIKTLTSQSQSLQARHKELQQRDADLARKQQLVNLVLTDRPAPVPVWFLGYLGEAVPPDLVVTNLSVRQETNQWRVKIAGTFQTVGQPRTPADTSKAIATLRDRLVNGPFHLRLATGDQSKPPPPGPRPAMNSPAFLSWVTNLASGASATASAKTTPDDRFAFEGVIR